MSTPSRSVVSRIPKEAVENGADALRSWLATAKDFNDTVPAPSSGLSGKWVQRVPKSLHARLAAKAEKEGISLKVEAPPRLAGLKSGGQVAYNSFLRRKRHLNMRGGRTQ